MTGFSEREQAYETKFQHDQETLFRIQVRRARLLGAWVAGQLGLDEAGTTAYVNDMVVALVDRKVDIREKATADLLAAGHDISRHRVDREADMLLEQARSQVAKA